MRKFDPGILFHPTGGMKTRLAVLGLACLLWFAGTASAQSLQQTNVTLSSRTMTVKQIFNTVTAQLKYEFFYSNDELNVNRQVTLPSNTMSVDNLLKTALGSNYVYRVNGRTIVITPSAARSRQDTITGLVTHDGKPVVGATVQAKGTLRAVATEPNGRFRLICPAGDKPTVVVVSFVGMETQEVTYKGVDLRVAMYEMASSMDGVIITGYQVIEKTKMTGAATTIKMEDIEVPGINTIDKLLEGHVPGMIYQLNSGQVGATPRLRIRGSASILGNREPLWVLDGVVLTDPVKIDPQDLNNPDFVNLLGNAIAGLNPDDIDQIDILKDAAATAMYGVQAGNGVIVITTKKGKPGPPSVRYSGSMTVNLRPRYSDRSINMMTSAERIDLSKELYDRGIFYTNVSGWTGYEEVLQDYHAGKLTYDQYAERVNYYANLNTDWFDLLCRDSYSYNQTVSISGGTPTIKYYASLGYLNDLGVIKGEDNKRYSATLNTTASYERLTANFSIQASVNQRDYNPQNIDVMNYAYSMSRAVEPYKNGELWYYPRSITSSTVHDFNILNEMANSGNSANGNSVITTANLSYRLFEGFKLMGKLSYTANNTNNETYFTENTFYVATLRKSTSGDYCPVGGEMKYSNTMSSGWTARIQANYGTTLDARKYHSISLDGGLEVASTEYNTFSITRRGYDHELKLYNPVDLSNTTYYNWLSTNKSAMGEYKDNLNNRFAYFGVAGYTFRDRYMFNIHVRGETSNLFGARTTQKLMPIWALSGRWNIKQDILRHTEWVDDLSLRASFGYQANMLDYQTPYMIMDKKGVRASYDVKGAVVKAFANPSLKWEKISSTNVQVDFSLLDNKINGSIAYFYRKTQDAFLSKYISDINGVFTDKATDTYIVNSGALENKGVELSLNFTPVNNLTSIGGERKGWIWRFDPQLGQVLNTMLDNALTSRSPYFANGELEYQALLDGRMYIPGQPLNAFYSYRFKGLSHDEGYPIFYGLEPEYAEDRKDASGNTIPGYKTIYEAMKDKQALIMMIMENSGRRDPIVQGGISNSVGYNNFSLRLNISYSLDNKIRLLRLTSAYGSSIPYPQENLRKELVKRWRQPGDENYTTIPALRIDRQTNTTLYDWWFGSNTYPIGGSSYEMYDQSDERVVSGNYMKIQSVSFTYDLPKKHCRTIGIQQASITLSGTNLFTWADARLKGQDPNQSGSSPSVALSIRPNYSCNLSFTF